MESTLLSNDINKSIYDKLPKNRQFLVDAVIEKMQSGELFWEKGWIGGAQYNPITKVRYKGVNSLYLSLIAKRRGYKDPRWITFKQMTSKKWSFKKDAEVKGKGCPIEYYTEVDAKTGKPLDRKKLSEMTAEERRAYFKENPTRFIREQYIVFNAELIEGMPALKKLAPEMESIKDYIAVEGIIKNSEAPISYDGGDKAYYRLTTDSIHLPERQVFKTQVDFYATALHEIGHSTGHSTRLNRDMSGFFATPSYAREELRAELFSLLAQDELGIALSDTHVENHAAYLQSWLSSIKENPNELFKAIADAEKICDYVIRKNIADYGKTMIQGIEEESTPLAGEPSPGLLGMMVDYQAKIVRNQSIAEKVSTAKQQSELQ